jgi:hypothetical protein
LETHCDAVIGIGRGRDIEPLRAMPRAEPLETAGATGDGRDGSTASTGRVGTGVARTGARASAITG